MASGRSDGAVQNKVIKQCRASLCNEPEPRVIRGSGLQVEKGAERRPNQHFTVYLHIAVTQPHLRAILAAPPR